MLARIRTRLKLALHGPPPPVPNPGVDLFYWRPPDGRQNFGDHLSYAIVAKMAATRSRFLDEIVPRPSRMLAIGSVLHFASDGDTIWGSGRNGKIALEEHRYRSLDVRAVRGPMTAEFLGKQGIEAPRVYGDPALLSRRLLGERFQAPERKAPVGFVPNLHDMPIMAGWENVISPFRPWSQVIREIIGCELIISSSLHGLVIADAFGIPCTYLRLSESENLFKYEDYVLGAGRQALQVTSSREEAVAASPMPPPRPDLDRLMASFPWDLWD